MFEVTDNAMKELKAYFASNEVKPIRIYLAPGGCSGPRLSLALDEVRDSDESFAVDEYTFVMDKELAQDAKPIKVDMGYMGFNVESSLELGGGGCSSCSSCGGGEGGSTGGCGC